MKRVIDGKLYDTGTALEVATWNNGHYPGDFHRCEETLYGTRKGAWFLHGEGGALSAYAEAHGNDRCGGEALVPMTREQAFEWCQQRKVDPDVIQEHFSDLVEEA